MMLLLRAPAADLDPYDPESEVEIAASPDTHARRPWEWDVRLTHRPEGLSRSFDGAGLGRHHVDVRVRPDVVTADLRTVDVGVATTLERDERELWVLVVESGRLQQGRFVLVPGDVLVCEGDDPQRLEVAAADAGQVSMAVVVLRRVDGQTLRWVP
jgi:hypothetical protein